MKSKEWLTIDVLKYLESNNLLVAQMPKDGRAEIYDAHVRFEKRPVPFSSSHTHYIMCGGDVVHIGNQYTCERFRV